MADVLIASDLGHVVITGGCGMVGLNIVDQLLQKHPRTKVSVIDIRTDRNRREKASYHDCDITNASKVSELFAQIKPDVIIHTASPVFVDNKNNDLFYKVNVEGTKTLLKAGQENGVKAFIYTSSASVVMGEIPEMVNADERWPLVIGNDQPEYYTTTKGLAEQMVLEANRQPSDAFLTCAIRPAGIFGEGDAQITPKMIEASRKGQSRFQVGENDNLFDFTYVGNVAHAHILAAVALLQTHKMKITPLDTERVDGEAFFITNDEPVYFWDFPRMIWREDGDKIGVDSSKIWVLPTGFALGLAVFLEGLLGLFGKKPNLTAPSVRFSTLTRYFNISKAKLRLSYAPIFTLEEGVKRAVRHYNEVHGPRPTPSSAQDKKIQ